MEKDFEKDFGARRREVMKITKSQLKRIIKEELKRIIEDDGYDMPSQQPMTARRYTQKGRAPFEEEV